MLDLSTRVVDLQGWQLTWATDINTAGQIAVSAYNRDLGERRGVILTPVPPSGPVPEPATLLLFGSGAAAALLRRRVFSVFSVPLWFSPR